MLLLKLTVIYSVLYLLFYDTCGYLYAKVFQMLLKAPTTSGHVLSLYGKTQIEINKEAFW